MLKLMLLLKRVMMKAAERLDTKGGKKALLNEESPAFHMYLTINLTLVAST